jgi:hypothetical protein
MKVYFILDEKSKAVKIGKANSIQQRLPELQTGNPNKLKVIYNIKCNSERQSKTLEKELHKKFQNLRIRDNGEWFNYDEDLFKQFFTEDINFVQKERRSSLIRHTLFGEVELFGIKNSPTCYFYPNLVAQIRDSYENASKMSVPFRTMDYPTNGKQMILPYSHHTDIVFISDKKHKENLELNKFNKRNELVLL